MLALDERELLRKEQLFQRFCRRATTHNPAVSRKHFFHFAHQRKQYAHTFRPLALPGRFASYPDTSPRRLGKPASQGLSKMRQEWRLEAAVLMRRNGHHGVLFIDVGYTARRSRCFGRDCAIFTRFGRDRGGVVESPSTTQSKCQHLTGGGDSTSARGGRDAPPFAPWGAARVAGRASPRDRCQPLV